MTALIYQRCLHHADREAVARCPECRQFFCRECVSEHDDRVICSACLAKAADPKEKGRRRWGGLFLLAQSAAAVGAIWFFFFLIGHTLLKMPATFHHEPTWLNEAETEE